MLMKPYIQSRFDLTLMPILQRITSLVGNWKPYDPSWLVDLAIEQAPDKPWLADALAICTLASGADSAYIKFVDSGNPNAPGSEWQFDSNIVLHHPIEGEVVIDVLKGRRIGGVELWEKLL